MEAKDLFRAGVTLGGPVTVNGPMFDIHDNACVEMHVQCGERAKCKKDIKAPAEGVDAEMPSAFMSVKAQELRARLEGAGLVDAEWRSAGLSLSERGVLAHYVAEALGIDTPWKTFARLWGMNPETLRSAFNKALDRRKTLAFQERLKGVM